MTGTAAAPAPPPTRREVERKLSLRSAASDTAPSSSLPIHPPPSMASLQQNPSSMVSSLPLPSAPFAAPPPGSPSIGGGTDPFTASGTTATASAAGMSDQDDLADIGEEEEEEFSDGEMMTGDVEFSEDERHQQQQQQHLSHPLAQVSTHIPAEASQYHQLVPGQSVAARTVGQQQDSPQIDAELKRRMEGERLVKSGYLLKKGERRKTWKKRWFVLRTEKLAYYKDDKVSEASLGYELTSYPFLFHYQEYVLCRILNLRDIHSVLAVQLKKNQHHTIGIVTRQRTYYVRASSGAEMEGWIKALNETRRALAEADELVEREGERKRARSVPPDTVTQAHPSQASQPIQQTMVSPVPIPASASTNGNNHYHHFRQATVSESMSGLSLSMSPRSGAPLGTSAGQNPSTAHLFPSYISSSTVFSQSPIDAAPANDIRKLSVGSSNGGAGSDVNQQQQGSVPRHASVPLGDSGVRKRRSDGSLDLSRLAAPVHLAAATPSPSSGGGALSTSFSGNGFEEYGMTPVVTGAGLAVVGGTGAGGIITSSDSEDDTYPPTTVAVAANPGSSTRFARTIDFDSHPQHQTSLPQQPISSAAASNATSPTVTSPYGNAAHVMTLTASPPMSSPPGVPAPPVQTDPHKVILSGYLMKLGNKRKTWRKRWFVLTSGELVYTKSHMDTKVHRSIPLNCMLDALEFDALPAMDSADDSTSDDGGGNPESYASPTSPKSRANSHSSRAQQHSHRKFAGGPYQGTSNSGLRTTQQQEQHTFQVITPRRTFKLCAPTEEEEIKWLAALRALINRERGAMSPGASIGPSGNTGSSSHSSKMPPPFSTPINNQATQTAKAAVAEVVRRFHTESSHLHSQHPQAQT
ncbi:hypothetical protein QFC19_003644 [Naganishia cerealis]|uniref:Uncharacterized protein n=1 Tax=Naganishia cerealis TaxID=610337 RepID=A0ACC2W1J4_9TREE|nr:hypothetical protein QFC19_003644 [Naganishia cerealis]